MSIYYFVWMVYLLGCVAYLVQYVPTYTIDFDDNQDYFKLMPCNPIVLQPWNYLEVLMTEEVDANYQDELEKEAE